MKSRTIVTAGGILLLILAGALLLPRSEEAPSTIETPRAFQATPQDSKSVVKGSVDGPKAEPVGKDKELPEEERAVIFSTIEQASVTYSSTALPVIEPFLLHPDPEVRLAAMNGMIVLGEAAAGPLLRKAAENMKNPNEAVALAEAADFVELPSGTFVPKDRTSREARIPLEGEPGTPGERPRPRHTPSAEPKEDSSEPAD